MQDEQYKTILEFLEEIRTLVSKSTKFKEPINPTSQPIDLSGIEQKIDLICGRLEENNKETSLIVADNSINNNDIVNQKIDHVIDLMEKPLEKLPAQKHLHWHTVNWKSPTILVYITMFLVAFSSLVLNIRQYNQNSQKRDNDLKYRYLKMKNRQHEFIWNLEDAFEYNRNEDLIKQIDKEVNEYEKNLQKNAERYLIEKK